MKSRSSILSQTRGSLHLSAEGFGDRCTRCIERHVEAHREKEFEIDFSVVQRLVGPDHSESLNVQDRS